MKNMKRLLSCLFCALLVAAFFAPPRAAAADQTDVQRTIEDILTYKCRSVGAADIDALIDGDLTANAGITADWYIFGLRQYGYDHDYSGFSDSLKRYAETGATASPVTDERIALLFACLGTEPDYIRSVTDDAIGSLGVMSYVYGLHLLNNGYASRKTDAGAVVNDLLGMQKADGGWAVMGDYGDVDVTAMTLAALAPYYPGNGRVKAAADRALALLSARQTAAGGFSSFGQESPESAAQVIVALTSLGIDPLTSSDFIKNGKTAYDAMLTFRLSDGSFEHTKGKGPNHTATVQAFYSSVALWRFLNGQPGLYVLGSGGPSVPETTTAPPAPVTEKAAPVTSPPTTKPSPRTTAPVTTEKSGAAAPSATAAPVATTPFSSTDPGNTASAAPTTAGKAAAPAGTTVPTGTTAAEPAGTTSTEPTTVSAETALPGPDQAVSVIRPERRATLPALSTKTDAAPETATDAEGTHASRLPWLIGGALGAAVITAVILLLRKKSPSRSTAE